MTENNSMTGSTCDAENSRSSFVPVLLIGLSFVYLYAWQLKTISDDRASLMTAVQQQEEPVKQSMQTQGNLEKIANGLLLFAQKGDPDAKAIVEKYKIQVQGNAKPQK